MNASELRINNLVMDENYNIVTITHEDFMGVNDDGGFPLRPIPLTEEWLVKFGFIQTIIGFESVNEYFPFSIEINSLGVAELYIEFYGGDKYKKLIKYVHQLQNLYFALTGEELTSSL